MMSIFEAPKNRRLNIMISESMVEWASSAAETSGMSVSAFVRQALEREYERSHEQAIAHAADALAPLYRSDEDLTAFSALDGDDFA